MILRDFHANLGFFTVLSLGQLFWCVPMMAAVPHSISKPAGDLPANNIVEMDGVSTSQHLEEDSRQIHLSKQAQDLPRRQVGLAKSRVIPRASIAVVEKTAEKPQKIDKDSISTPQFKPVVKPVMAARTEQKIGPKPQKIETVEHKEIAPREVETHIEEFLETTEVYKFAGRDKADPFIPPIGTVDNYTVSTTAALDAEEIPIVSPLQYHGVRALAVTGIWQAEDNRWKAMIETPDQQGIIAQNGDPIGNSGGHVSEIGPNGVKVREYTLKKDGSRLYSDFVIGMASDVPVETEVAAGKIVLKPGAAEPEVRKEELPTPSPMPLPTVVIPAADTAVPPQKAELLPADVVLPLPIPGVSQLTPTPLPGGTL